MPPNVTESALRSLIFERLVDDAASVGEAVPLIEAALDGEAALGAVLAEAAPAPVTRRPPPPAAQQELWLTDLTVSGFRGIGPPCTMSFEPGPGIVVVTGRNGCGKSSFAEALEVLLTGDSRRFVGRTKEWREGWRNLHHATPDLHARFVGDGAGFELRRSWTSEVALSSGRLARSVGTTLESDLPPGLEDALRAYRPLLGTTELGRMLDDGPSAAYDALKAILGLQELTDAAARLATARKTRKKTLDALKEERQTVLTALAQIEDDRAREAERNLRARPPDLDALQALVVGAVDDPGLAGLRRRAAQARIDLEGASAAIAALRTACEAQTELAAQSGERERRAAELLDLALRWHAEEGDGACPVCETPAVLDLTWRAKTAEVVAAHQEATARARGARQAVASAESALRAFVPDSRLTGLALCEHAAKAIPERAAAVEEDRESAVAELAKREDRWQPVAVQVAAWVGAARGAEPVSAQLRLLEQAEDWVKRAESKLRDERFTGIATQAQAIWSDLRQRSSVELVRVALAGSGTHRRVELGVTVDGADSAALSVMSQGEINALALALFLPRATLKASPFRFLVIDDPVQSMDPGKVDGLSKVLERIGKTHQVLVFTHDPRLAESMRRLRIAARVVEVTRRQRSVVEVRDVADPVEQHLRDARTVAMGEGLGGQLGKRVVPMFCREALEACLQRLVRARRIARGDPFEDIEAAIAEAKSLRPLAALALFDDADRHNAVAEFLERKGHRDAERLIKALNAGAHQPHDGDLVWLVDATRRVVQQLPGMAR